MPPSGLQEVDLKAKLGWNATHINEKIVLSLRDGVVYLCSACSVVIEYHISITKTAINGKEVSFYEISVSHGGEYEDGCLLGYCAV
jgi:hypothetical protein